MKDSRVYTVTIYGYPLSTKWQMSNKFIIMNNQLMNAEQFKHFKNEFEIMQSNTKKERHLGSTWYVGYNRRLSYEATEYVDMHAYELQKAFIQSNHPVTENFEQV